MDTIATALPIQMARVREILGYYKDLGPPGMFGAAMIEESLAAADKAAVEGDLVGMIAAYKDLQTIT